MAPFEFSASIPADRAFAAMIRDVVAHGARQSGSTEDAALEFACQVEDAVRDIAGDGPATSHLTVAVSTEQGPLTVVITSAGQARTLALDR